MLLEFKKQIVAVLLLVISCIVVCVSTTFVTSRVLAADDQEQLRTEERVLVEIKEAVESHLVAKQVDPPAPDVTTGSAIALGESAMTVSGSVHPHGTPTTYRFEYGSTPSYGSQTEPVALPPRLAAYYHESWDDGFAGWGNWYNCERTHYPTGGPANGYMRFTEQEGLNDFNHEASGSVHLMTGFDTGPVDNSSAMLSGGDTDFRGGKISLWVRGHDWKPNGSEFVCWLQTQSNIEVLDETGWRRANWAFTGESFTEYLLDGEWHHVRLTLHNDPDQWTYAGNNPFQQGPRADRYEYWSLDNALAHLNINFLLLSVFVDPENPPTGSIDFGGMEMTYRNRSLLQPSNGGTLIAWPQDSDVDPAAVTDGWRHGERRMWHSAEHPTTPQEFVYSFENEVNINTVQLHQNPEWPGKDVEVLVSTDGESFTSILKNTLPEKGDPGPNNAFSINSELSATARFIKVCLTSGYRSRHWGLGEIEVFGTGATMLPDDDVYSVNLDIPDLTPGTTYHYRLVAESGSGTSYGEDRTFMVPATRLPQLETGRASRVTPSTAKVEGRLNPMGYPTFYHFQYGTDTEYTGGAFSASSGANLRLSRPMPKSSGVVNLPVPGMYGGLQMTPRTVQTDLTGLEPGTTYHYQLVAHNQFGVAYGPDATFTTTTEAGG